MGVTFGREEVVAPLRLETYKKKQSSNPASAISIPIPEASKGDSDPLSDSLHFDRTKPSPRQRSNLPQYSSALGATSADSTYLSPTTSAVPAATADTRPNSKPVGCCNGRRNGASAKSPSPDATAKHTRQSIVRSKSARPIPSKSTSPITSSTSSTRSASASRTPGAKSAVRASSGYGARTPGNSNAATPGASQRRGSNAGSTRDTTSMRQSAPGASAVVASAVSAAAGCRSMNGLAPYVTGLASRPSQVFSGPAANQPVLLASDLRSDLPANEPPRGAAPRQPDRMPSMSGSGDVHAGSSGDASSVSMYDLSNRSAVSAGHAADVHSNNKNSALSPSAANRAAAAVAEVSLPAQGSPLPVPSRPAGPRGSSPVAEAVKLVNALSAGSLPPAVDRIASPAFVSSPFQTVPKVRAAPAINSSSTAMPASGIAPTPAKHSMAALAQESQLSSTINVRSAAAEPDLSSSVADISATPPTHAPPFGDCLESPWSEVDIDDAPTVVLDSVGAPPQEHAATLGPSDLEAANPAAPELETGDGESEALAASSKPVASDAFGSKLSIAFAHEGASSALVPEPVHPMTVSTSDATAAVPDAPAGTSAANSTTDAEDLALNQSLVKESPAGVECESSTFTEKGTGGADPADTPLPAANNIDAVMVHDSKSRPAAPCQKGDALQSSTLAPESPETPRDAVHPRDLVVESGQLNSGSTTAATGPDPMPGAMPTPTNGCLLPIHSSTPPRTVALEPVQRPGLAYEVERPQSVGRMRMVPLSRTHLRNAASTSQQAPVTPPASLRGSAAFAPSTSSAGSQRARAQTATTGVQPSPRNDCGLDEIGSTFLKYPGVMPSFMRPTTATEMRTKWEDPKSESPRLKSTRRVPPTAHFLLPTQSVAARAASEVCHHHWSAFCCFIPLLFWVSASPLQNWCSNEPCGRYVRVAYPLMHTACLSPP
jgi:hypothetical protein